MPFSISNVKLLAEEVRTNGWARVVSEDLDQLRRAAELLGWTEVALRVGDPAITNLRPTAKGAARMNSLSAEFGLGELPLHTDGAHLREPPDIIVLYSKKPNETRTVTWTIPSVWNMGASPWRELDHGVFLVRNGAESFFAPARLKGGIRYDAGCMKPCDSRARRVAEYFASVYSDSQNHSWDQDHVMLLVDNLRTLHGRGAVVSADEDRLLQRVAFRTGPG